jgi:hypothetical protein
MPCDNSSGVGNRSENVVVTLKLRFKFFEFLNGGFYKRIIQNSRCCHFIGGLSRWGEIRRRPFDNRAATVGRVAHKAIGFALLGSVFCHLVLRLDFFSGTPGPPPFSVMNATPADSRAVQMASIFQRFDGKETFNVSAGSLCSQCSRALAACTCSLVIMPWSQDQLAMSVVHFEKPKPWRRPASCLLCAPAGAEPARQIVQSLAPGCPTVTFRASARTMASILPASRRPASGTRVADSPPLRLIRPYPRNRCPFSSTFDSTMDTHP